MLPLVIVNTHFMVHTSTKVLSQAFNSLKTLLLRAVMMAVLSFGILKLGNSLEILLAWTVVEMVSIIVIQCVYATHNGTKIQNQWKVFVPLHCLLCIPYNFGESKFW